MAADSGGYWNDRGFDPDAEDVVPVVPLTPLPSSIEAQLQADSSQDGEDLSATDWKTIASHTREVVDLATTIGQSIGLGDAIKHMRVLAARWHDIGKAAEERTRSKDKSMRSSNRAACLLPLLISCRGTMRPRTFGTLFESGVAAVCHRQPTPALSFG